MILAERPRAQSPIAIENVACVAGVKRGGGGGGGGGIDKREKGKEPSLPPIPLPFFPPPLSPTPFDACYAGYRRWEPYLSLRRNLL